MAGILKDVQELTRRVHKSLECAICLDILDEPHSTQCNHQFCKNCLDQLLSKRKKKSDVLCPLCKAKVSKRGLRENVKLSGIVNAVRNVLNSIEEDHVSYELGITEANEITLKNENKHQKLKSVAVKPKENISIDAKAALLQAFESAPLGRRKRQSRHPNVNQNQKSANEHTAETNADTEHKINAENVATEEHLLEGSSMSSPDLVSDPKGKIIKADVCLSPETDTKFIVYETPFVQVSPETPCQRPTGKSLPLLKKALKDVNSDSEGFGFQQLKVKRKTKISPINEFVSRRDSQIVEKLECFEFDGEDCSDIYERINSRSRKVNTIYGKENKHGDIYLEKVIKKVTKKKEQIELVNNTINDQEGNVDGAKNEVSKSTRKRKGRPRRKNPRIVDASTVATSQTIDSDNTQDGNVECLKNEGIVVVNEPKCNKSGPVVVVISPDATQENVQKLSQSSVQKLSQNSVAYNDVCQGVSKKAGSVDKVADGSVCSGENLEVIEASVSSLYELPDYVIDPMAHVHEKHDTTKGNVEDEIGLVMKNQDGLERKSQESIATAANTQAKDGDERCVAVSGNDKSPTERETITDEMIECDDAAKAKDQNCATAKDQNVSITKDQPGAILEDRDLSITEDQHVCTAGGPDVSVADDQIAGMIEDRDFVADKASLSTCASEVDLFSQDVAEPMPIDKVDVTGNVGMNSDQKSAGSVDLFDSRTATVMTDCTMFESENICERIMLNRGKAAPSLSQESQESTSLLKDKVPSVETVINEEQNATVSMIEAGLEIGISAGTRGALCVSDHSLGATLKNEMSKVETKVGSLFGSGECIGLSEPPADKEKEVLLQSNCTEFINESKREENTLDTVGLNNAEAIKAASDVDVGRISFVTSDDTDFSKFSNVAFRESTNIDDSQNQDLCLGCRRRLRQKPVEVAALIRNAVGAATREGLLQTVSRQRHSFSYLKTSSAVQFNKRKIKSLDSKEAPGYYDSERQSASHEIAKMNAIKVCRSNYPYEEVEVSGSGDDSSAQEDSDEEGSRNKRRRSRRNLKVSKKIYSMKLHTKGLNINPSNSPVDGLRNASNGPIDGLRSSSNGPVDGLRSSSNGPVDGLRGSSNGPVDGLRSSASGKMITEKTSNGNASTVKRKQEHNQFPENKNIQSVIGEGNKANNNDNGGPLSVLFEESSHPEAVYTEKESTEANQAKIELKIAANTSLNDEESDVEVIPLTPFRHSDRPAVNHQHCLKLKPKLIPEIETVDANLQDDGAVVVCDEIVSSSKHDNLNSLNEHSESVFQRVSPDSRVESKDVSQSVQEQLKSVSSYNQHSISSTVARESNETYFTGMASPILSVEDQNTLGVNLAKESCMESVESCRPIKRKQIVLGEGLGNVIKKCKLDVDHDLSKGKLEAASKNGVAHKSFEITEQVVELLSQPRGEKETNSFDQLQRMEQHGDAANIICNTPSSQCFEEEELFSSKEEEFDGEMELFDHSEEEDDRGDFGREDDGIVEDEFEERALEPELVKKHDIDDDDVIKEICLSSDQEMNDFMDEYSGRRAQVQVAADVERVTTESSPGQREAPHSLMSNTDVHGCGVSNICENKDEVGSTIASRLNKKVSRSDLTCSGSTTKEDLFASGESAFEREIAKENKAFDKHAAGAVNAKKVVGKSVSSFKKLVAKMSSAAKDNSDLDESSDDCDGLLTPSSSRLHDKLSTKHHKKDSEREDCSPPSPTPPPKLKRRKTSPSELDAALNEMKNLLEDGDIGGNSLQCCNEDTANAINKPKRPLWKDDVVEWKNDFVRSQSEDTTARNKEADVGSLWKENAIRHKKATIIDVEATMRGKETTIRDVETTMRGKETAIRGVETTMRGKETTIRGVETTMRGKETTIRGLETITRGKETAIRDVEAVMIGNEATIREKNSFIRPLLKENSIENKEVATSLNNSTSREKNRTAEMDRSVKDLEEALLESLQSHIPVKGSSAEGKSASNEISKDKVVIHVTSTPTRERSYGSVDQVGVEKEVLRTPVINAELKKKNVVQRQGNGFESSVNKMDAITIVPSRLKRKEMSYCKAMADKLGCKFSTVYVPGATHLVMGTDENLAIDRSAYTCKYLMALITGSWIIGFKWVLACLKIGKLVSEEKFEVKGDPLSNHQLIPKLARLSKVKNEPPLFSNLSLSLIGELKASQINKEQLLQILSICGAKVTSEIPKEIPEKNYLLITDRECLESGLTSKHHTTSC
eukprot:gene3602-4110_t